MMTVNGVRGRGGALGLPGATAATAGAAGCFLRMTIPYVGLSDRREPQYPAGRAAASTARRQLEGAAELSFQEPGRQRLPCLEEGTPWVLTRTAVSHPEVVLHLFLVCRVGWASGTGLGSWGSDGSMGCVGRWVQCAG